MPSVIRLILIAAAVHAAGLWAGPAGPPSAPVTVSAAISLTDALEEAGRAFGSTGGGEVRFNFAGSNVLARQIVNGAPVDLFISADEAQMRVVEQAGLVAAGSRVDLLGNHLAVVRAKGAPAIADAAGLAHRAVRRIALGDPEAVPAGAYAKQYLQNTGLWPKVESKIVPVANVRAALAAADAGTADAAIVYDSDVLAASSATLAFIVSGPSAPRIVYPAAVLTSARNPDAALRFLTFLRGAPASALFRKYRFEPRAELR
jgi:molybdate transport system substrate-binding protein